jgi:ADP-heptose:LPS heptosyltransferase
LCVRPDNMGDLLMSAPAISALKETFGCSITLLTSTMAEKIAAYIPAVDHTLVWNVPWVKGPFQSTTSEFTQLINTLRAQRFDAAVIFTVFSQNPLPTALVLTLAEIPYRLAYCRENPYHLLSHWVPEKEPYSFVRHQVRRDLDLVRSIGAYTKSDRITIQLPDTYEDEVRKKLTTAGADPVKPWLIMHPGVSEVKREYPADLWIESGRKIRDEIGYQLIITGAEDERMLADHISNGIGEQAYSMAGLLSLEEFITLIRFSPVLISVNTGSVHLAAAVQAKVIVLYALTNPQHAPWKAMGKILPYSIPEDLLSQNQVLQFVQEHYFRNKISKVRPHDIFQAAYDLLINRNEQPVEELITSPPGIVHLRNEQHPVFP